MKKWIAVIFMLCITSPVWAEVTENKSTVDNTAQGNAEQSLLDTLNNASPVRVNGRVFHGYTDWNVKWDLEWKESKGGVIAKFQK